MRDIPRQIRIAPFVLSSCRASRARDPREYRTSGVPPRRLAVTNLIEISEEKDTQPECRELTRRTLIPAISLIPQRYLSLERTAGRRTSVVSRCDLVSTFPTFAERSSRVPRALRQQEALLRGAGGGDTSRIAKITKLPLRRQVRGRPGRCSKSHYPHIIVFNSFSRRIISRGLARPPIRSFLPFFFSSLTLSQSRTALISRSLVSPLGRGKISRERGHKRKEASGNYENVGNRRIGEHYLPRRSVLGLRFNGSSLKFVKGPMTGAHFAIIMSFGMMKKRWSVISVSSLKQKIVCGSNRDGRRVISLSAYLIIK